MPPQHSFGRKPLLDLKPKRLFTVGCHFSFDYWFPPTMAMECKPVLSVSVRCHYLRERDA